MLFCVVLRCAVCTTLQGGNVADLATQLQMPSASPSPVPAQQQDSPLLLPQLNIPTFGGTTRRPDQGDGTPAAAGAAGNATAPGSGPVRVQLGPGTSVDNLAQDITEGRYVATDLDK